MLLPPLLPPPRLATIQASPLAVATIRTYGAAMLVYGLVVVIQDPRRWSGPSFKTITAVADPWVWGLVLAVFGFVTVIGSIEAWFGFRNVGLYGGAAWFGLFAIGLLDAARKNEAVSFTGLILYAAFIVNMCLVARAREGVDHARLSSRL